MPAPGRFRAPTRPTETPADPHRPWAAGLAWGIALIVAVLLLASATGPGQSLSIPTLLAALVGGLLPALLWMIPAAAIAALLRPLMPECLSSRERTLIAWAIGVGVALWIDSLLGRLGVLASSPVVAWGLTIVGGVVLLAVLGRQSRSWPLPRPTWTELSLVPAIAVLAVATISAPGWLWSSEFGGYDVLAYHLQLPKEWRSLGVIEPLAHNVYSHLPNHVEASTLRLMMLVGGPLDAALPAQMVQALLAVSTAALLAATAARLVPSAAAAAGLVTAGLFLGTPWVTVVGSLAYDEMAVCLPLAAIVALLTPIEAVTDSPAPLRLGLLVGILAGSAVAAKATSVGFVALPAVGLLLARLPRRGWLLALAGVSASAVVVLAPWLVQNLLSAGQPFFPILAEPLGGGGWSPEQAATFAAAHGPDRNPLAAFLAEALLHGIGPSPESGEPWRPQWSLLWPLGLTASAIALASTACRANAIRLLGILAVMIAFWMGFTHLESRFLVPAAVPLSLLIGLSATRWAHPDGRTSSLVAAALTVWGLVPVAIYLKERPLTPGNWIGAPAAAVGQVATTAGEIHRALLKRPGLSREERGEVLQHAPPWTFLNEPTLTGHEGRVLLVGESRVFYLDRDCEYVSVWDRGRLSMLAREYPDDPDRWVRELSQAGFTMVLFDGAMIKRWRRNGWLDPALSAEAISAFTARLRPLRGFGNGVELFAIGGGP